MSDKETPAPKPDILIVDDTPANLNLLLNIFKERGYRTRPVTGGKPALQAAEKEPPDLILLDINMPEMNGYEVCERLKADRRFREIPVIFLSALNETIDKVRAFSAGGVDYVTKPFQSDEVLARVETHLKLRSLRLELEKYNRGLEEMVAEKVREIAASQMATIFALAKLAESRDSTTGAHLERVQEFCRELSECFARQPAGRELIDTVFVENIHRASPLHDIGKVGVADSVLLKPAKLTAAEFEIMKTHTGIGAATLEAVRTKYPHNKFINMGIIIARSHHEKWNGRGYPDGLAGEKIPLPARIMALADVYDALRGKRPYKPAFSHKEACGIILEGTGSHFDPVLVEVFSGINGRFEAIWNRAA